MASPPPLPAPAARRRTGRAYAGQAASERIAGRRTRLIDAGIALFGSQGLRATTVRGVCTQAGLTDRYFYESFASLEALLAACYEALLGRLGRALAAASASVAGQGMQAHLVAGYGAWFDFIADPLAARIMLAEVLGVSPAVDALYEAGMCGFADAMAAPLAAAGASGARIALIGRALVGAVVQVAKMWADSGYRETRADVVQSCVLVALGTVRALQAEQAALAAKSAPA